jgi:hypothetical protein
LAARAYAKRQGPNDKARNEKTGPKGYTAKPPAFAFCLRQKDCGPFACFPCAYFLQEFRTRYFLQILFAPIALFLRAF